MRFLCLSIAVAVALPHLAEAAPCDRLPNPIYLQVGDTQTNLMKRLGRALRDNTGKPITLVFRTSGSCTNIEAIYQRVAIPANTTMQYVPSIAEDPAWMPASPTLTCEMPAALVPDIANSALFNSACTQDPAPATVKLSQGPVQAYVMAVPEVSQQKAMTHAEAYFVFGFGMAGMIMPWIDEQQLHIRSITKSTLLAWAANISVPADRWKGVRHDGSSMVVAALESSTSDKAIGILGAEVYDARRDKLNILAFRARGQYAAYYPDSSATSFDKKNVRDGHYTVWSPTIWMDTTDAAGAPVKPDARYVVDLIVGKAVTPQPSFDMIETIASVGLVPDCAMGVTRDFEGGDLRKYEPAESCVCKFESLKATTTCQTCTETCASGVCRNGYCEVR